MNEILNPRRLALVVRSDLYSGWRMLGIVSAAIAGVIIVSGLLFKRGAPSTNSFYFVWYVVLLFTWGLAATSRAFIDLHDRNRNTAFLLLPASALEKVLARLLMVSAGFIFYLVAFMFVVSAIGEAANWLVHGRTDPLFRPFAGDVWRLAGHFILLQSVFFLGAAWFRSYKIFKTILAVLVLIVGYVGFVLLVSRYLLFGDMQSEAVIWLTNSDTLSLYRDHRLLFEAAGLLAELGLYVVLPLFCWAVAWLRVRETQVSHGV
jgi:hypothetical protein